MSSKQKRAISLIGITGAVYLVFRYLLPLGIPFFAGWVIARSIWPLVKFLRERGKIPILWGALFGICVLCTGVLWILWIVGGKLVLQLAYFVENLPVYVENLCSALGGFCQELETLFHLSQGCLMQKILFMAGQAEEKATEYAMPYLMSNSVPAIGWVINFFTVGTVALIAAILMLQERDKIRAWRENSCFRREIALLTKRLGEVGGAYLRTEFIIMIVTMAICMAGLMLMGNEYGILIGVIIGIVDVLPVFGSGTVFIPWILWELFNRNLTQAAGLAIVYFLCYGVREGLEAKLLGNRIGMSGLETLISMYVGLELFGIVGLFLGPIGWILIKEIDKTWNLS